MAREIDRLSALSVKGISKPGRHADGGGLYLVVDKKGAKRWCFLFRWQGKLREMGLGGVTSVSLAKARTLAGDARSKIVDGVNPIEARKADKPVPTFKELADDLIESLAAEWRSSIHKKQWETTIEEHAKSLHAKRVDTIGVEDVLKVLKPLWNTKPATAARLRGRLERILDAAEALGHRAGKNPAAWRGGLKSLLPAPKKLVRGHHAALPFTDVSTFIGMLRKREGVAASALEFTILTAARSGEVLGATWGEIDLSSKVWIIPGPRMKSGRPHRVPLSSRAIEILEAMKEVRTKSGDTAPVFPGQKLEKPLSPLSMKQVMRRMSRTDAKELPNATPHGFRSAFRDWAGEMTSFPREVAEAALAHTVGDETERAYRRGDALEKRRHLMDAWSSFCTTAPVDNVVQLQRPSA